MLREGSRVCLHISTPGQVLHCMRQDEGDDLQDHEWEAIHDVPIAVEERQVDDLRGV